MKKRKKQEKAITLVALVITIILLLILAGISIQALTNQGIFEQAHKARKESQRAQVTEWLNLKLMEVQMQKPTGTAEQIIEATRVASYSNTELAQMGKKVVVDESTSTLEDGEQVPVYFYVQVDDDVYKVEMSGAKFIGEKGKFPPVITLENVTKTTNSITLKIKTSRNEEGELKIYIKSEDDADYTIKKTATGNEATGLEYTISELLQNKNYSIKIVATAKNGQIKEYIKDVPLGSVPTGEGAITFTPATWSNGKASTIISSTEIGYTIQYQVNSTSENGWTTGTNVTGLLHNDKLYARLWDGTNGGTVATNNIIDGTDPSASIDLSATTVGTTKSITATVTHTDNESGVSIENCKWVYNTTASAIGTDASSYTGGTFSSNPQTITLSATTAGTYYLHVLTTDVAGRTKETISNAVTVQQLITEIQLNKTEINLKVGETETLTATISPSNTNNKKITWISSNTDVATVSEGTITAVSKGTTTITAIAQDGSNIQESCTIKVEDNIVYLYNEGDECEEITGGCDIISYQKYIGWTYENCKKNTNNLFASTSKVRYSSGFITINSIDLTDIKKIYMYVDEITVSNDAPRFNITDNSSIPAHTAIVYNGSLKCGINELDVSLLNGKYYVAFGTWRAHDMTYNDITVKQIWLEK